MVLSSFHFISLYYNYYHYDIREDYPWVPPSIDKAKEYKETHIFGGGRAPFWKIDLSNNQDLGIGVSLYFYFLKSFATSSFFNTILSAPNLYLAAIGHGVSKEFQDGMGLYKYTLGNIGNNRAEVDYLNKSACVTEPYKNYNGTCISTGEWELSTIEVSSILTCLEILQIFVFFCSLTFINWHADNMKEQREKDSCSITDYTITVKNLPPDVTSTDLIVHFNQWCLDRPDFQGRPKVQGAQPVRNSEHTGDPIYLNTWIAEAYLHKQLGQFIDMFKSKMEMTNRLYRARAQVKMYGPNTVHAKGYNERKYKKALLEHDYLASKIASMTSKALKNNKNLTIRGGFGDTLTEDAIEAKVVQAFVTFEHTESFARCLEDYTKFSSFPWNWCYPEQLKLRGRLIKVHKAHEPDEIVWENLEIKPWSKRYRRSLTNLITLVWIIVSFAIILQASLVKQQFKALQPDTSLCKSDIPLLFNLTETQSNGVSNQLYPAELLRPDDKIERTDLDKQCNDIVPGTFYVRWEQFHVYDDGKDSIGSYNINACTSQSAKNAGLYAPGGLCPTVNETNYCPCITLSKSQDSNEICQTAECKYKSLNKEQLSGSCVEFHPSAIGYCYCSSHLVRQINTVGLTGIVYSLATIDDPVIEPCRDVLLNYTYGVGLSYVAVCITVMINYFLLIGLKNLTKKEAHECFDNIQASLLRKMFLSTYFNVSMIPLIAYGNIRGLPSILVNLSIFQGPFDDFSHAWYGNVGAYFITTFLVQAASPPAYFLFDFYVFKPYARWKTYGSVRRKDGHKIVKQDELNKMEVGPIFDATGNIAQMLLLIFLAMTFAPGEPIFMPLMCLTAWLYMTVDKYLLLRFYEKPPIVSDGLIRMALSILTYATIFRLAFACWMFGNPEMLDSGIPNIPGTTESNLEGLKKINGPAFTNYGYYAWYNKQNYLEIAGVDSGLKSGTILSRAFKPNIIPMAALLAIIVWYKVVKEVWHLLPIHWIIPLIKGCFSRYEKSKIYTKDMELKDDAVGSIDRYTLMELEHPLRQEAAPFSGEYFKYLCKKDDKDGTGGGCCKSKEDPTKLTLLEEQEGYFIQTDETDRYLVKMKRFTTNSTLDGKQRIANTIKRTYEHISDHGCNSYSMIRIPGYSMVFKGLMEGVAASLEEENNHKYDRKKTLFGGISSKIGGSFRKVAVEPEEVPSIYQVADEENNVQEEDEQEVAS